MKIKSLNIKNFKSIVDITINEPNPFTVFVGPNGSGKSNIFEALEFGVECFRYPKLKFDLGGKKVELMGNPNLWEVVDLFDGIESARNKNADSIDTINISMNIEIEDILCEFFLEYQPPTSPLAPIVDYQNYHAIENFNIYNKFLRIIQDKNKHNYVGNVKLTQSCDNLERVLRRLLESKDTKEEITEWLELFIPEFENIEVLSNELNSNEELLIYQKYYKKPFKRKLISNGTYNILCLLTAVFQSDEPQFLCIEEPENGLNPKVVKELVNFFRDACEEKGHYIWLNTHSQTLVSQLREEEMIIVDKVNGETKIKQFKSGDFYGMPADEALLTNALGGGIPW